MFSLIEKKLPTVVISSSQQTMDIEAASLRAGDEYSPFALSPEQLGTLHNPKNLAAFSRFGGIEGLLEGLRSDQITGLSVKSEKPVDGFRTSITRLRTGIDEDPGHNGLCAQRRAIYLDNHLPTKKQPSFLHLLWLAYNDPVLFLLTAAAAVSLAIGLYQTFTTTHTANNPAVEWVEGVTILVAVIIIVLVGSINDWNKLKQFKRLNKKQLERDAKVVRCGISRLISGSDILVGDIVLLEPGDVIPADGILIKGYNVMCDESTTTGESELVHKTPGDDAFHSINECDDELRRSLAPMPDPFMLSGTKVLEGVGTFLVTATGLNSTYGKILASIKDDSEPTPLQVRLGVLAKNITRIGVVLALLLFVALFIRFLTSLSHGHSSPAEKGKNFINILIIALTVLVIAVPEGLPLAVTLSLAYATTRMLKDHNLVRQLKACETMGNATNICSDKTGTLTQNKMAVVAGMVGPNFGFQDSVTQLPSAGVSGGTEILSTTEFTQGLSLDIRKVIRKSIALNTTAFEDKEGSSFVGSNTESALLNFARDHLDMGQVAEERSEESIVQFIPFSASRQCTAAVIKLRGHPGVYRVFVKGASEVLLSKCTRIVRDPTLSSLDIELTSQDRRRIVETINTYASQALRTISLVYRDFHLSSQVDGAKSEPQVNCTMDYLLQNLVFLGVIGIHDPLRPGVPESVQTCQRAGVTVRMVTGDNLLTAKAIAKQCGILSGDASDVIMEGAKFRALSNSEMGEVIPHLKVLARSSPEDKRKLVVWLKEMGEIVAVTGDGTNDASAMSAADVSFSMGGVGGTEVAREASSIILLTDDFTSIVKAIKWGRAVNDSVKKFLQVKISAVLIQS
jgi:P-type Ca2+ transporter type 2C